MSDLVFSELSGTLDVGVGYNPRGDVNVDLFIDSRQRRMGVGADLKPEEILNFVQADGRDMHMFKDRQFPYVRCWHLMEHLPDWWNLLKELYRVTDKHLEIIVPNRYFRKFPMLKPYKNHVSWFDKPTMEKAIIKHLKTRTFQVTSIKRGMFHPLIPFPLWPFLVKADIWRMD